MVQSLSRPAYPRSRKKPYIHCLFDMKALTDGAQVRFFIRDAKNDNLFIMREGFDLSDESTKNQSAAAYSRVIKKAGRWSKVSASFDFSKRSMLLPASKA